VTTNVQWLQVLARLFGLLEHGLFGEETHLSDLLLGTSELSRQRDHHVKIHAGRWQRSVLDQRRSVTPLLFHCSHCLVIYSVSPCKLLGTKIYGNWFSLNSNSNPLSSVFKPCQMELVWKPQTSPHNHANLNSQSGRPSRIGILRNLSDFSKQV
jgi:hypothetical protein